MKGRVIIYKKYTKEQKDIARNSSVTEVLLKLGEDVIRCGKEDMWESPRGLVSISKNVWFNHYQQKGGDVIDFRDGVKNSLREDCDILVIGEIRDKETMEAAIDMAESGHLVIGTLHTKSCAETIDRIINFYEIRDQATVKYLMSALLKLVVSQRLLKGVGGKLVLVPEVMVVDNIVAGIMRKEKITD